METFLIQEINYLHLSASSHTPREWLYVGEGPVRCVCVCVCVCSPGIMSVYPQEYPHLRVRCKLLQAGNDHIYSAPVCYSNYITACHVGWLHSIN